MQDRTPNMLSYRTLINARERPSTVTLVRGCAITSETVCDHVPDDVRSRPRRARFPYAYSGSVIGKSSHISCRKMPMKKDMKVIRKIADGKVRKGSMPTTAGS